MKSYTGIITLQSTNKSSGSDNGICTTIEQVKGCKKPLNQKVRMCTFYESKLDEEDRKVNRELKWIDWEGAKWKSPEWRT